MRIAVVEKDPADRERFVAAMNFAMKKYTSLCGLSAVADYYESVDDLTNAVRRLFDAAIITVNDADDIEAAAEFWRTHQNIPVALVGPEMCGAEYFKPGALRYMKKPLYGDYLLTTLRRCNDAVYYTHVHAGRG